MQGGSWGVGLGGGAFAEIRGAGRATRGTRGELGAGGQRPPTPTPPSQSRLPRGASTQFGPGSPPVPSPLTLPLAAPPAAPLAQHLFVNQENLDLRSSKPLKPNLVFKTPGADREKQPQSIHGATLGAYALGCTKYGHWGAGRRLKMRGGYRGQTAAKPLGKH